MTSIQEKNIELIFTKPIEVQSFGDFKVQKNIMFQTQLVEKWFKL